MNINVSAWSIRNPVPSVVLFLVLMVLGIQAFQVLPVTRFPNIDVPLVQVRIYQAGAAPTELETQVTKRVEDAISGVNGVKHITSTITEGSSLTNVEFRLEIDSDRALNDVKDAVQRIRTDLPRTIEEPVVTRIEIQGLPIVSYAARSLTMTPEELSWFVDDIVARHLQGVPGVSEVRRMGGVEREIRIDLDPDRLLSLGVTAGEVNAQVRASNVNLAGGRGEIAGREQAIRTLASQATVQELAATMIPLPGGRKVRLDELGTVTDAVAEPRSFAKLDGEPIVAFSVSRAKGASDTTVAAAVDESLKDLHNDHPDVALQRIDNTVDYTMGVYEATMKTLLEGAILAVVVVFLFLRDLRATAIAAVALPLSIVPAFWAMDAMDFSLNLVSLLAVTIVTGILVDDAIVEIENIDRHIHQGKSAWRASLEGADEIGLAVIATTLTIIAVFMPVSFMGGIAGQYFKQFGLVVSAAVFFSLLVARLITPMMTAYFLKPSTHDRAEGWIMRTYTRLVGWSVRHYLATVFLGLMVFAGSVGSFYLLPSGFLPTEDSGRMLLGVELPPGSRLDDTERTLDEVARRVASRPDVESAFALGGVLLGSGEEVRKGTIIIMLTPRAERALSQGAIRGEVSRDLSGLPDMRYFFMEDDGQREFQLVVTGRDGEAVTRIAAELTSEAKRLPGLTNVVSTAELDRPELRIYPRSERASELGITTEKISEAVRIATIGDIGANLAKFDVADRQVPIRVQLRESARESRDMLEELKVATTGGGSVPLSAVARFDYGQSPTAIDRYDRTRRIVLGADLVPGTALGDAIANVKGLPAARDLPPGVEIREFGAAEIMGEVFDSFAAAMTAGLMMVYAVLVLLFASFLQPITILFSLPLSLGGAILGLAVTGNTISLPVVIGVLMLMGIVTKNAILLVDFGIEEMRRGADRRDAIVDAGRKRARPIVMTTIAMAAGMLPSALAFGSGGEFRAPMAIAVIGGLLSSTLLSLVFVPAVFVLMDDVSRGIWRIFGRFVGGPEPGDEQPSAEPRASEASPAE